ncbi:hypothetical protein N7460_000220 [Penicillium canescens]|uniref:Myb-like domain-containing protein n=2 Tax=Penicillium canescens TaxID=5083 RepID=A0AAD6IMS0_PENCN|nr:hypothetical protein N7460_000220 [Penicillium canescens]
MGFVSEPNELPRANSPDLYHNDELSTAGNYPDYPEEVALYPSSRVSDTPSVAGLEGPGTTRVFDVFEDDRIRQSDGEYYRNCAPKERKRALENSNTSPPKRRRYRTSTVTNANKPRGKRASPLGAGDPPLENTEGYSDSNLAGLRNAIGYLKRAYSLVTAEAKFSDDIAGADILKENLSVLQLATKTLQHAYGIIATSTTAMENVAREATTVQQRSTFTRSKWTVEDDHRLLRLRDSQNLSWSRIRDLFPERTMNAIRTRYSRESSKHSEPLSSKENHSVCTGRQVKGTSSIRRSPRLSRPRRVSDRTSNAERERRYPSRAAKHSSGSNALNLDSIDPRLRNINNV